jgi:CubicO group peptidase (beta-lactamase class C family)
MFHALADQETLYEPATHYKYSNLGFSILGEVVAAVSGESYADYVQKHILTPLHMNDSTVLPKQNDPLLATGYSARVNGGDRHEQRFLVFNAITPAASITSNVVDLAHFVSLQFRRGKAGGEQILSGSTLEEMQRPHAVSSDWKGGRGLGWSVRKSDNGTRVGHDGAVDGFRARIQFDVQKKIGVIVLANAGESYPGAYADQIFSYVAPLLTSDGSAAKKVDPQLAARYAGDYFFEDDTMKIVNIDGQLAMITPDEDNAWESRVMLEQLTPTTFREIGGGSDGELLRFELDPAGKVVKVWDAYFYWWPKKQ